MYAGNLVHNPQVKRPIERPEHRWKDNIKMGLSEIVCEDTALSHLAQNKYQ
jgi:hypothetical protein